MIKFIIILIIMLFTLESSGSHLESLKLIEDSQVSKVCPYLNDVASNSFWYQWRVDNPGSGSYSINQVKYYSNASGAYNVSYALASNSYMFEGYWGGLRLFTQNLEGSYFVRSNPMNMQSSILAGPNCPSGHSTKYVYIFCPSNSIAENDADFKGFGGGCGLNNHRGFLCNTEDKVFLSTGLWESE